MDIAEYHKMHALERHHWWFQGRRHVILKLLREATDTRLKKHADALRLLDIGCGTGMLLEDFSKMGTAVGLDASPVALAYCKQHNLTKLARADVQQLPIKDSSVHIITALDLIEHVKNDHGLVREISRALVPGGIAVMAVPAHKSLWSNHDRALHHFRRYEKKEFAKLVNDAGFRTLKYTYAVSTAYLPAMVYRRVKRSLFAAGPVTTDEFLPPKPINSLLFSIMQLEAKLMKHRNLPFGLSLVCVAQKPE